MTNTTVIILIVIFIVNYFGVSNCARFGWNELNIKNISCSNLKGPKLNGTLASTIVKKPVFVSITTIASRLNRLHETIWSILIGPVIPDRVFVFLSTEPFLIDVGISIEDIQKREMLCFLLKNYPVSVVFTENIGPHRKLLPLLDRMWSTDCLIVTFDDEPKYWLDHYLGQLISYYVAGNESSIVALKARRFSFCSVSPFKILPYSGWGEACYGMHEYFLLPTGTGGILYRPRFFHPIVFDREYISRTKTTDDLAFRMATMINGVFVTTGCRRTSLQQSVENRHGSVLSRTCLPDPTISVNPAYRIITRLIQQNYSTDSLSKRLKSESVSGRSLLSDSKKQTVTDRGGLFGTFNRKNGNDRSFYNAYFFLRDLGILDLATMAKLLLRAERGLCFQKSLSSKMTFPGGEVSCMLSKCRHPDYFNSTKSVNSTRS